MNHKINCWEFHNCGMEPGGMFSDVYGPCPVPLAMKYDGFNGGRAAGRVCWKIMDSPNVRINNPFISCSKRNSCCKCAFYNRVRNEEPLTETPTVARKDIKGLIRFK